MALKLETILDEDTQYSILYGYIRNEAPTELLSIFRITQLLLMFYCQYDEVLMYIYLYCHYDEVFIYNKRIHRLVLHHKHRIYQ